MSAHHSPPPLPIRPRATARPVASRDHICPGRFPHLPRTLPTSAHGATGHLHQDVLCERKGPERVRTRFAPSSSCVSESLPRSAAASASAPRALILLLLRRSDESLRMPAHAACDVAVPHAAFHVAHSAASHFAHRARAQSHCRPVRAAKRRPLQPPTRDHAPHRLNRHHAEVRAVPPCWAGPMACVVKRRRAHVEQRLNASASASAPSSPSLFADLQWTSVCLSAL